MHMVDPMQPDQQPKGDPFPRKRFTALLSRLPRYARLAWRLSRDPQLSSSRRLALAAGLVYLLSPIDLVPGVIPVAGQLDDAAAALTALRFALRGLPAAARRDALLDAGLEQHHIDDDLRTIGACYAWMLRTGGRATLRASRAIGRGAGRLASRIGARLRRAKP
jgi:uncharacterized membrane protein YkvA (DUF1232 family)